MNNAMNARAFVPTPKSQLVNHKAKSLTHACLFILLAATGVQGFGSTPVTQGYRDFNYGTGPIPFPSGQKTDSKLWWNDESWWGALWSMQTNAWDIFKFDPATQDWTDTGTTVDNRRSLVDCLWDGANNKLYIVSYIFTETGSSSTSSSQWGRLYRFTYDSATQQYTMDAGFPVTVTRGEESTLTIAKDSFGVLWVSYLENSHVMINHSTTSDTSWGTPYVLPGDSTATRTDTIDLTGTVALGGNKIGVMWTNDIQGKFYFAVHNDGDADTVWQPIETAFPTPNSGCTGNCAHRHLNVKVDSSGQIYAAGLTGLSGTTNIPVSVFLMFRDTFGAWQSYQVSSTADSWVRPVVLLDEQNGRVYTFASSPGSGGAIYFKSTSLSTPSFPTGIGAPFIQSSTDTDISNAASTKQTVNGTTGILVLASDQTSLNYLHNFIPLPGSNGPVINAFSPSSGAVGTSVTIAGSKLTGATAVEFNGTAASSFSVDSDSQITTSVPSGATTGPISVTSPGGTGISASSFTVIGPPMISSFNPSSGPPGSTVTITGSGFTGTTDVSFNGASGQFTVNSDTKITTFVPSAATTGPISVTTPVGSTTSAASFTVTQVPLISSFSPTNGRVGTSVTVTGSHFTGATTVTFNGTSAAFVVNSDTQITASVPGGATTGPISVATPGGTATSSSSFTVTVPPSITSFSPSSGIYGASVTITGAGFTGTASVTFNGTAATFTVASDTQINTAVPTGATSGPLSVTTPIGSATSSGNFSVLFLPVITSFSPTSGRVGTIVTIAGSHFTGTNSVKFNGKQAPFTIVSDTQITASVPKPAKTGPISVTNAAGTATSSSKFAVQ